MLLFSSRLRLAALVVVGIVLACSGADDSSSGTKPVEPPPPAAKPVIILSADSVGATLIAGAPKATQSIDVSAGTSAALAALSVADVTVGTGQPATWIAAALSAQTAPAKLTITIDPNVASGTYSAVIRLSATDAESKSVRVSLVVKPRPRLVVDSLAAAFDGELGSTVTSRTLHVTSVDGVVDSLSISKLDCGVTSPAWLVATISSSTTPATVKLDVSPGTLRAGSYACSFVISTSQALVDSATQTVRVSLSLRALPKIAVAIDTVRVGAFRGADGSGFTVGVTNAGSGQLDQLSVGDIAYDGGFTGWLSVALDSTTAPATITVTPSARSLQPGSYTATFRVWSTAAGVANNPAVIPVRFLVSPIPTTGLVASPNPLRITIKASQHPQVPFSVNANGDSPLANLGFGPKSKLIDTNGYMAASIGCTGAAFATPCSGIIEPHVGVVGTFTYTADIGSYASNPPVLMTLTIIVTVTP